MSTQTQTEDVTPSSAPATGGPGPWSLTWHGVRTVAVLELRQRVRSTRWVVSLVVFAALVGGVTLLTWLVARQSAMGGDLVVGNTMFGFIAFFVLFLGLLVSPTLSATSINGDRSAGTLATLQVTLLSAAEIVLGKLLAAWLASLAFLAVSLPFLLWAMLEGGAQPLRMLVTLALLAVLLAVVCAIGLGFSALTARTAGSAVLTYVSVASISIVSLIVFGLSLSLVTQEEQVRVQWEVYPEEPGYERAEGEGPGPRCEWRTETWSQTHTERTWWLLAVNPFVIVADAAPRTTDPDLFSVDPLTGIQEAVRAARTGPSTEIDYCSADDPPGQRPALVAPGDAASMSPVWPWGLGANLLLGVAGVVVAVRRLSIPQRTLQRGTRVA